MVGTKMHGRGVGWGYASHCRHTTGSLKLLRHWSQCLSISFIYACFSQVWLYVQQNEATFSDDSFSPLMNIYSPAQNNFQQFSELYLPTVYVWFYISFGVLHGKFIHAKISLSLIFSHFKHINIHFLSRTLSTEKNNALLQLNYNVNVFVAKNDLLLLSKYNVCNGF